MEHFPDASVAILAKTTIKRLGRRSNPPNVRNATVKSSISSRGGQKSVVSTTFRGGRGSTSINGEPTANASILMLNTILNISAESEDDIALKVISGVLGAKLLGKTTKLWWKQKVKDPQQADQ